MAGVTRRVESGTDWSRYTPFSEYEKIAISVGGTYQTAFSVTGQGFLSNAIANVSSTEAVKIKITVDGSVIFASTSGGTPYAFIGLVQYNEAMSDAGDTRFDTGSGSAPRAIDGTTVVSYPHTTEANEALCILTQNIFFYSSLLIEITRASANNVDFRCSGGYIV